jgi:hypothetical protein
MIMNVMLFLLVVSLAKSLVIGLPESQQLVISFTRALRWRQFSVYCCMASRFFEPRQGANIQGREFCGMMWHNIVVRR